MESILICGDSFSTDWSIAYDQPNGWPNLLEQHFKITNLSQAGCSEYKIYLQILSMIDRLDSFDKIIVSHTSPYRLYTKKHPIHWNDNMHAHCDLLYQDIKYHSRIQKNLLPLIHYFENYFDLEHAEFVHRLTCEKIENILQKYNTLHLSHISWKDLYQFKKMIQFENLFEQHPGLINHYNALGNQLVYEYIINAI